MSHPRRGSEGESQEGKPSFAVSERRLAVAVLCSDLAHEMTPTLAFLREIVRFGDMSETERSIGEDEIARLQSLIAALRKTKRADDARISVKLRSVALRAAELVRSETPAAPRVDIEVPSELSILANERGLEIALVALLRNALAAGAGGRVVIRSSRDADTLRIEVEDDGPGVPALVGEQLFLPLMMLGPEGCGTGLAAVLRVARDHGWELSHGRRENRTVFCLEIGDGAPDTQAGNT